MRAGRLNKRVTIQKLVEAADGYGDVTETATTNVATVWASVEPLTGREFIEAKAYSADVTHRVRMRYLSGITSKHQLRLGTRRLNIEAVINVGERNRELELMCKEAV